MYGYGGNVHSLLPQHENEKSKDPEDSWECFVGFGIRFLFYKALEEPFISARPCHLHRLTAESTGRKCWPPTSLSFLFLYYWFVQIVYEFTDHTDVLFRCFLCESVTHIIKICPSISLNIEESRLRDATFQLAASPHWCLVGVFIDCSEGIVLVGSWLPPFAQQPNSKSNLWLGHTCKQPTGACVRRINGRGTPGSSREREEWAGTRRCWHEPAASLGLSYPLSAPQFFHL